MDAAQIPPNPAESAPNEIAVAVRNTLKLGSALLLTWTVALIVKFQVPAHLGPVLQGHFGFAESFAGMFFTALGFGIDTYIIKEVSVRPKHASDFLGGVFALRGLVSVVLFGAMAVTLWATGRPRDIQLSVFIFGLAQLALSFNNTLSAVLQAATKVGRLAAANVGGKIIWGVGLLVGLHYNAPLYMLAMPLLGSEILRAMVLFPTSRSAVNLEYHVDWRQIRPVLVASIPFFVNATAIGLGNNLTMTSLEFIRKDDREVGWFAAAQNIATLAMLLTPLLNSVVMPLLSRARAASEEEMMAILRRVMEALIVLIAPVTVMISAGSDILVRAAFGERYAPAATGLSILTLVFVLTYLNMILSASLIVLGRSWSVTMISLSAVASMALFMIVFVPIGRALFHTGGECAGAAMAFIANEACVILAMLPRFDTTPFDSRNLITLGKTLFVAAIVLGFNHVFHHLGFVRLVIDAALYVVLALVLRIVHPADIRRALVIIRARKSPMPA